MKKKILKIVEYPLNIDFSIDWKHRIGKSLINNKTMEKEITKEAKANYANITMAVGTSRFQIGYLPVELIARAIATGIGDDLETLTKWLGKTREMEETIGYAIKKGLISEDAVEWTYEEKKDYCDKSDVLANEKED